MRVGVFLIDDGMAEKGLALLDEALALLEVLPTSPELDKLIAERINFFVMSGRLDEAEAEIRRCEKAFGTRHEPDGRDAGSSRRSG